MSNIEQKLDDLNDKIFDIKITQTKQEVHLARLNDLLSELNKSVDYHIKRSDTLEELVQAFKEDTDAVIKKELAPINSHITLVKGAMWTLGIVGTLIMALHQLGILQRLF
jgi:uncharacterized coiled-coil protein SlyX